MGRMLHWKWSGAIALLAVALFVLAAAVYSMWGSVSGGGLPAGGGAYVPEPVNVAPELAESMPIGSCMGSAECTGAH
jgi:hypothetical protein